MATALEVPVLWKDIRGTGIEGTEVVAADELPQCGWEGATVNDLIRLLDDKFENSAAASRASYVRQVKSLLLYGTHLSHGRLLSSVIVSLSACCPRLVATTRLVRAKSKINIFVQPPNGRLLCLVCALDETIDEVKRKIEDRTGYPPAQQRLTLSGKHLYGSRTLAEYSAYSECTLYLVNRLCGGYINDSAKKFADVTDDSLVGVYEFSTHAPAWRKVGRGLNLEGQCGTPSCAAFRHWIIHQHGFNSFNLYRDGCIHCPMCASEVTPLTCLFYDCVWKYEGARAGDGVHLSSGWKSAIEDGKYHRFDVDEIRGIVAWEGLLIIVQSMNVAQAAMLVAGNAGELTPRPDKMCCVCWSPAASMKRWSPATSMKKSFAPIACGHSVHSACIAEWGSWCKRGRVPFSCPVCRKDLSNEALTPHLA